VEASALPTKPTEWKTMKKRVDHGINNSTFINIKGKGGLCERAEKFMQIMSAWQKFVGFLIRIYHEDFISLFLVF